MSNWVGTGIWFTLSFMIAQASVFSGATALGDSPEPDSLHFYNRAGCAAAAFRPATSALMIADSYNLGKMLHGIDPNPTRVLEGMVTFRQTLVKLTSWISEQILSDRAPLLPENLRDPSTPIAIRKAVEAHCPLGGYCAELDPILDILFRSREKFSTPLDTGCNYVREVSRLHSPLYSQKPDLALLEGIARDDRDRSRFLKSCFSLEKEGEIASRSFLVQFDVRPPTKWNWAKTGHNYWHSLRLYLSWAWRRLPLENFGAGNYSEIFKNLDLEEMILFTGNGCETISAPACDQEHLSIAGLRDLVAQSPNGVGHADVPDISRVLPDGPDALILNKPVPANGSDGLHLQESKTIQEWIQSFRQRLVAQSVSSRVRLNEALNQLQIITANVSLGRLVTSLKEQIRASSERADFKPGIYALCAEYEYAGNQDFGVLRDRIRRLTQISYLKESSLPFDEEFLNAAQSYYQSLSQMVLIECQKLESSDFWKTFSPPPPQSSLFSPWYREARERLLPDQTRTSPQNSETIFPAKPLLRFNSPLFPEGEILCAYGADCAQRVLKNIVEIIAAFSYAESILQVQSPALASPLFNRLADATACRSYDPWFKTRKTIREFIVDLANTALFGWNPIPVYFTSEVKPGQLYSLKKLVQDGKLVFEPQRTPQKTAWSLGLDAGPLVGVPCVVVLKNSGGLPRVQTPYFFEGIQVAQCGSKTKADFSTGGGDNADQLKLDGSSHCVACQLSFGAQGAAKLSWVSNHLPFNPVKLGVYLIGTFVKLFRNLDDQVDRPREWNLQLSALRSTIATHGRIPKKCVDPLLKGGNCEARTCESDLSRQLARGLKKFAKIPAISPVETQQIKGRDYRTDYITNACEGKIRLFYDRWETAECSFFRQPIVQRVAASRDCQRVVEALKKEFLL